MATVWDIVAIVHSLVLTDLAQEFSAQAGTLPKVVAASECKHIKGSDRSAGKR